jgi:citrate lyase subunit beta/citryl-CoA lyase
VAFRESEIGMKLDLTTVRSLLFLPTSNPRAIAKARTLDADVVILDLEDAVRSEDKGSARDAAVAAVAEPWRVPVAIRVNGAGTEWHSADLDAVARSNADMFVLPRAASAHLVSAAREAVGKPLLAMIETAAGVLAAAQIASECAGLIAGTNDLAADLRLPLEAGRGPLQTALQSIVLAARAAGIPCFDGVFNALDDFEGLDHECRESRQLGFDGKSLIHPTQIEFCHRAFAPTLKEVEQAERLVAAANGGAERFEGRMIERMHVEQARRLLERASL